MKKISLLIAVSCLFAFSCKKEKAKVEQSTDGLSREDVLSLEKNSVFTNEAFIYKGVFEGKYFGDKIVLKLSESQFIIEYNGKT